MEIIIGSTSNNIEGSRVLSSKHRKGLLPIAPRLTARPRTNQNWDIEIEWFPPRNKREVFVDYSIEYQILSGPSAWVPLPETTNLNQFIADALPNAYKARVKANYIGISSEWVETQSINLFINVSFDLTNSFHTLMV